MENNEILDSGIEDQQSHPFLRYEEASSGKRFANYIIDTVIHYILCFIVGVAYSLALNTSNMGNLEAYSIALLVVLLYYTILESTTGKTIGKFITKTKVVNYDDYGKPSTGTIFKRTLCRFIPFEAFSFFGSGGWHDTISGTMVVND